MPSLGKYELRASFQFPPGPQGEGWEATDEERTLGDGSHGLARARGPAFVVEASSLKHQVYRGSCGTVQCHTMQQSSCGARGSALSGIQAMDDQALLAVVPAPVR